VESCLEGIDSCIKCNDVLALQTGAATATAQSTGNNSHYGEASATAAATIAGAAKIVHTPNQSKEASALSQDCLASHAHVGVGMINRK